MSGQFKGITSAPFSFFPIAGNIPASTTTSSFTNPPPPDPFDSYHPVHLEKLGSRLGSL